MTVTVFLDVLSHWCYAAQPAVAALQRTLADDMHLEIRFAPVFDGGAIDYSAELYEWFYRRGAGAYGTQLDANWRGGTVTSSRDANAAVAAAIALGADPQAVSESFMREVMRDGQPLFTEDAAARSVAAGAALPLERVLRTMRSDEIADELRAANARLAEIGCAERPSWLMVNDNGDRAVLQGVWQAEAILPLARALLEDERAYRRAGPPPKDR
ncbi:MAG: DsbA family protein [Candidatus Eremiobacteraeota bacterium]|nr:DsbA family protein [Candidatus Eremiobacteraeota bacterium]